VGQVPMVPRAEGDDYDSRLAAYVTLFNGCSPFETIAIHR
jgi:hypothetical protein